MKNRQLRITRSDIDIKLSRDLKEIHDLKLSRDLIHEENSCVTLFTKTIAVRKQALHLSTSILKIQKVKF